MVGYAHFWGCHGGWLACLNPSSTAFDPTLDSPGDTEGGDGERRFSKFPGGRTKHPPRAKSEWPLLIRGILPRALTKGWFRGLWGHAR